MAAELTALTDAGMWQACNRLVMCPVEMILEESQETMDGKKVKQSCYRSGVAQRVPGS